MKWSDYRVGERVHYRSTSISARVLSHFGQDEIEVQFTSTKEICIVKVSEIEKTPLGYIHHLLDKISSKLLQYKELEVAYRIVSRMLLYFILGSIVTFLYHLFS